MGLACATALLAASPAATQQPSPRIENQVAVFAALDKVTAHISRLEIKLGDTAKFGSLRIKPLRCYSRPPDVQPKTSTFVEVREVQLDSSEKNIFSGWMLAENPGLNAVEHPVYDVWLTGCEAPKVVAGRAPAPSVATPAGSRMPAAAASTPDDDETLTRRRPPR